MAAGCKTGGEGSLEVETAGPAVYVDNFAGEKQSRDNSGFHGFGIDFLDADSAAGDHRPIERQQAVHRQREVPEQVGQRASFFGGYPAGGFLLRDSAEKGNLFRDPGREWDFAERLAHTMRQPVDSERGRGLRIIQAISRRMDLTRADGQNTSCYYVNRSFRADHLGPEADGS